MLMLNSDLKYTEGDKWYILALMARPIIIFGGMTGLFWAPSLGKKVLACICTLIALSIGISAKYISNTLKVKPPYDQR